FAFDWAHNNTLQVIPPNEADEKERAAGRYSRFRPGNIVFSYRSNDVIGVIERPSGAIVWAWGPGVLDGQHKPHMLPNGRILIYDNGTLRKYSRVIEVDPLTGAIEWEYTATPRESFFSPYISGAQRLPNGNTLICEGGKSRLFEVTQGGEVVWDFVNPFRERDSRGAVYRCLRYPPEAVRGLLQAIGKVP
ncbi:MAG: PQQ-binding-like beta-propeller repeat protein, partial [Lentisphaeria bacterium]|nr:PQQ-binding-like beta-propeller repeat protein [Lentisphaeria bacterium]